MQTMQVSGENYSKEITNAKPEDWSVSGTYKELQGGRVTGVE